MPLDTALALDFLSPLALIALFSWSYGIVLQRHAGPHLAPILLGLLFGLVAILQMNSPVMPVEGVILDLRTVPVVLAGAFLGRRGLAACLVVAMTTRWHIGGIGMPPDMLGIMLSGVAGLAWDRATRSRVPRGFSHLLVLGSTASVGLLPGLLLPAPIARWYLAEAFPALFLLQMSAVLLLAGLLERERHLSLIEAGLFDARSRDRDSGMLTRPAFLERLVAAPSADGSAQQICGILVVTLAPRLGHGAFDAGRRIGRLAAGLGRVIGGFVANGELVARAGGGRVVVALSSVDMARTDPIMDAVRRAVSEQAEALSPGLPARLRVRMRILPVTDGMTPAEIGEALDAWTWPDPGAVLRQFGGPGGRRTRERPAAAGHGGMDAATVESRAHPALFERTARMMERRPR